METDSASPNAESAAPDGPVAAPLASNLAESVAAPPTEVPLPALATWSPMSSVTSIGTPETSLSESPAREEHPFTPFSENEFACAGDDHEDEDDEDHAASEASEPADGGEASSSSWGKVRSAQLLEALAVPFRNLDTGEVMTLTSLPATPTPLPRVTRDTTADSAEGEAGGGGGAGAVVCCGYLWKRGKKSRALARRWYVLRGGGLCYYPSAHASVHAPAACRSFDLGGARVEGGAGAVHGLLASCPLFAVTLRWHAGGAGQRGRFRELFAEHPEEQALWVRPACHPATMLPCYPATLLPRGAGPVGEAAACDRRARPPRDPCPCPCPV